MNIKDVCCNDCGCNYEVDELGKIFLIHYKNKNIETDKIKCPECNSSAYSERCFDDYWKVGE